MRVINKSKVREEAARIDWSAIEQAHVDALRAMTKKQRSEYLSRNSDWNRLQASMLEASHHKCWYSEAHIGSSDFEVDHFRPKNKATQHDGTVLKENGYWWLAYNWENYRLAGSLMNKRRKDRLCHGDEVKGKGNYFPLDLEEGQVADDEQSLLCEVPLLLDPFKAYDVSLLSFDADGSPISATEDEYEQTRVDLSIKFYHLDLEQLNVARKQVWDTCEREIKEANEHIKGATSRQAKQCVIGKCYTRILELTNEKSPYSSAAKVSVIVLSEDDEYKLWLKNLIPHI